MLQGREMTKLYPYVWFENNVRQTVIAKISQQDELTKFIAFQLID